jgi:hypothetical protein
LLDHGDSGRQRRKIAGRNFGRTAYPEERQGGIGIITNPKVVFIIVGTLAFMAVLSLSLTFVLIWVKADPVLIAIVAGQFGQTALTALITLLTNTRTQAGPPQPVTFQAPPAGPVPPTPAPGSADLTAASPSPTI